MQTPTRPLSPDAFHWKDDRVEDIGLYRPGGYHPVKLGDTFATFPTTASDVPSQLRYRVLHKLGHGILRFGWPGICYRLGTLILEYYIHGVFHEVDTPCTAAS